MLSAKDFAAAMPRNNTAVWENGDVIQVCLHRTVVAEIYQGPDGFVRLYSGGWRTVTTKQRMNAVLDAIEGCGWRIVQHRYDWFAVHRAVGRVPFLDDMRLYYREPRAMYATDHTGRAAIPAKAVAPC